MSNDSQLKQIAVSESDWVPGDNKPEADYQRVIATDGTELFEAYITTETYIDKYRRENFEVPRIWRKSNLPNSEPQVSYYLPSEISERILSTVPKLK